uniref:Uncharacterized protein n=1 Tax=uncultured marine virus TaxID=186617 RepID=A0A0F7L902_9VIRU|nr:hypothetical protein [uncultured marine virus]
MALTLVSSPETCHGIQGVNEWVLTSSISDLRSVKAEVKDGSTVIYTAYQYYKNSSSQYVFNMNKVLESYLDPFYYNTALGATAGIGAPTNCSFNYSVVFTEILSTGASGDTDSPAAKQAINSIENTLDYATKSVILTSYTDELVLREDQQFPLAFLCKNTTLLKIQRVLKSSTGATLQTDLITMPNTSTGNRVLIYPLNSDTIHDIHASATTAEITLYYNTSTIISDTFTLKIDRSNTCNDVVFEWLNVYGEFDTMSFINTKLKSNNDDKTKFISGEDIKTIKSKYNSTEFYETYPLSLAQKELVSVLFSSPVVYKIVDGVRELVQVMNGYNDEDMFTLQLEIQTKLITLQNG